MNFDIRQPSHPEPLSGDAVSRAEQLFPPTRYMGSKRKLLGLLASVFSELEFESALDPFCGTGAVAYLLKQMNTKVTASDTMTFNAAVARALVENRNIRLGDTVDRLLDRVDTERTTIGFVERTFDGLFFYREENRFIDNFIDGMKDLEGYQRDLALFALGQACLIKRPYNLFHRANLNMRARDVERSFGNKTTWDKPFETLVSRFAKEADGAVFDSGQPCRAATSDVLETDPSGYDLVYLDPPYISGKGTPVDYIDYYHFLEGLADPEIWPSKILHRYKHKPIEGKGENPWSDPKRISAVFETTIRRFSESTLVVSYRSDGIPSIEEITGFLVRAGKTPRIVDAGKYTYALSRNRRSREIVIVGE